MTPARIQSALFAGFGLPEPRFTPPPAPPERFPAIFSRPAFPALGGLLQERSKLMDTVTPAAPAAPSPDGYSLPDGAPTLARHLFWALGALEGAINGLTPDPDSYAAALRALADLPRVPPAIEHLGGQIVWREEDGRFTPEHLVKPAKLLEDSFVRTVAGGALSLSASLTRFKALAFSEAQALLDAVARDYGIQLGGKAIYLRVKRRAPSGRYELVSLDLASA